MRSRTGRGAAPGARVMSWAMLLVLVGLPAGRALGQQPIDLHGLMGETQQMYQNADKIVMVWWMPEQFWVASFAQNANMTEEMTEQFVTTLRPYTMIAVVDGNIGPFGGVSYENEAAVRGKTTLIDSNQHSYTPLPADQIDADTRNLLEMMKPVLINMLGPLGQNLHFLLFPRQDADGKPIADATGEGALRINVADRSFKYRMPLGSVLPPKYDPQTGERFPGNYNYNPFTATKLVTTPPEGKEETSES